MVLKERSAQSKGRAFNISGIIRIILPFVKGLISLVVLSLIFTLPVIVHADDLKDSPDPPAGFDNMAKSIEDLPEEIGLSDESAKAAASNKDEANVESEETSLSDEIDETAVSPQLEVPQNHSREGDLIGADYIDNPGGSVIPNHSLEGDWAGALPASPATAYIWDLIGKFKRTFYGTVPGVTGDTGASGQKLFEGSFAMNPGMMEQHDILLGDEICIMPDSEDMVFGIVLDYAEAEVVDEYRTGEIPAFGTDMVHVWVRRFIHQ